eukprot:2432226-Pleurochrysis_carterae.AAC.3
MRCVGLGSFKVVPDAAVGGEAEVAAGGRRRERRLCKDVRAVVPDADLLHALRAVAPLEPRGLAQRRAAHRAAARRQAERAAAAARGHCGHACRSHARAAGHADAASAGVSGGACKTARGAVHALRSGG